MSLPIYSRTTKLSTPLPTKGLESTPWSSRGTYQKWCLKHLTNEKNYKLLSKEEAWAEAYKLRDTIYKRTTKHKPVAGKDAIKYIRAQLVKDLSDPFAYFYLMQKNTQGRTKRISHQTCKLQLWKPPAASQQMAQPGPAPSSRSAATLRKKTPSHSKEIWPTLQ